MILLGVPGHEIARLVCAPPRASGSGRPFATTARRMLRHGWRSRSRTRPGSRLREGWRRLFGRPSGFDASSKLPRRAIRTIPDAGIEPRAPAVVSPSIASVPGGPSRRICTPTLRHANDRVPVRRDSTRRVRLSSALARKPPSASESPGWNLEWRRNDSGSSARTRGHRALLDSQETLQGHSVQVHARIARAPSLDTFRLQGHSGFLLQHRGRRDRRARVRLHASVANREHPTALVLISSLSQSLSPRRM